MPLSPNAVNMVECSRCSWARILDVKREYRSGHTNPASLQECHEMLVYTEVSPLPLEVVFLGRTEGATKDEPLTVEELATLETTVFQAEGAAVAALALEAQEFVLP